MQSTNSNKNVSLTKVIYNNNTSSAFCGKVIFRLWCNLTAPFYEADCILKSTSYCIISWQLFPLYSLRVWHLKRVLTGKIYCLCADSEATILITWALVLVDKAWSILHSSLIRSQLPSPRRHPPLAFYGVIFITATSLSSQIQYLLGFPQAKSNPLSVLCNSHQTRFHHIISICCNANY